MMEMSVPHGKDAQDMSREENEDHGLRIFTWFYGGFAKLQSEAEVRV